MKSIYNKIRFYRFATNIHKQNSISNIMCKFGRHDYEFKEIVYNHQGYPIGGLLECFYCLHQKRSYKDLKSGS